MHYHLVIHPKNWRMGSICFIDGEAILWRSPFLKEVQDKLVSFQNSTGLACTSQNKRMILRMKLLDSCAAGTSKPIPS
jgi:hypothetical protein